VQIGVASSSAVGIPVLQALLASHHKVDFVLTNPQKQSGRGQGLAANDFHSFSEENDIQVLTPSNSSDLFAALEHRKIDLIVTIAYGQLIKPESLNLPKFGWLNVHFSRLPRWRGASPVQSAILAGDTKTGISIFKLEEGMDTGPIFLNVDANIEENETTPAVLDRLSRIAATELPALLDQISNGLAPSPQSDADATYAPKFKKEDGVLNPRESVSDFLRKVRALGANPGTSLIFRGDKLKIDEAIYVEGPDFALPTASLKSTKKALYLQLGDGVVELVRVTPSGKKSMSGADFSRGARIEDGEIVE